MATIISPAINTEIQLNEIAKALIVGKRLTQEKAIEIRKKSVTEKISFLEETIKSGELSALDIATTLSRLFGIPLLNLDLIDVLSIKKDLVKEEDCIKYSVLPLAKRGQRIVIATSNPNKEILTKIKLLLGTGVDWILVEHDKLKGALGQVYKKVEDNNNDEFDDLDIEVTTEEEFESDLAGDDEAPIVKFVQKMLVDAINLGASDLHFEPYEHVYRIRFRVDGELREITTPPISIKDKLASRIKVISRLDISEKRVPQDGRMKLALSRDKVIDFRVSTLPTLFGEKIVIRILDPSSAKMGIDALGYEPEEKKRLLDAVFRPYGMVLVTGPTGSGKTVSLYSCLNLLNQPGVNISTAEDPSEINMYGVNQVNVNDKAGLTFAAALKSFLRQDPDIIMVGEIRDLETADISIKAAQTGHMVLSTLHTNDAPTTLTRMLNMGIAPFNIASSVILITAQRLARRLCQFCKEPHDVPYDALKLAGFSDEVLQEDFQIYKPVGCSKCNNGYKGRVGIYQVMPITEEIQKIILRNGTAIEIAVQAKLEGVKSLREAGLHKVKQGLTSLEEVLGVTNE